MNNELDPPVFARNPLAFESKAKHLSYHHLSFVIVFFTSFKARVAHTALFFPLTISSSPSLTSLIPFMKQPEEEEEIDELDSDSEPEIFSQPLGNLTQLLQSSPLPPPPTSKPLGLVELYSSLHIPRKPTLIIPTQTFCSHPLYFSFICSTIFTSSFTFSSNLSSGFETFKSAWIDSSNNRTWLVSLGYNSPREKFDNFFRGRR